MKLLRITSFFVFTILFFSNIRAQQQCAFDRVREQQMQDPFIAEQGRMAEERLQNIIQNRGAYSVNGNVITIPVVIHILHLGEAVGTGSNISDDQIQSSIDNLNDFYRGLTPNSPIDFEIEFALAQRDPNCNPSTGINRIDASGIPGYASNGVNVANSNGADYETIRDFINWPPTDYLNFWIVTELDNNDGGFGYQGYAYFYNEGSNYYGSVMMSTVFGYDPGNTNGWGLNSNGDNSTVVHEVGHYFHLYHTFQGDGNGSDCPADTIVHPNPSIGNSDGCADTVPHRRETSTCPLTNSCTGQPWVDNNTINNIMSYYSCTDRLTNDQRTRVRAAMEGTEISKSNGSVPFDPNFTAPLATCSTNQAPNMDGDYLGIVNVELNQRSFSSFSTRSDGGNIDMTDCNIYFEIDTANINTLYVSMFPNNDQQLGVWIDWNGDGDFADEAEQQIPVKDNIAPSSIESIDLVYPTVIPYGEYVRIRLITEASTVYGFSLIDSPCYNSLQYGQSEDYTIYIEPSGPINYVYDNGWSPYSPDGISAPGDTITIANGNATLSSDTDCDTVTLSENGGLTITSGATLTANSITLNSTSDSFSSLILEGSISGTVTYNRYVSAIVPVASNDLIAAPLSGQTFGDLVTNNSNLAGSGSMYLFGPYDTSSGAYQNYNSTSEAAEIINSGIGYRAATSDGSNLAFTGTVLNTDVLDVPISDATNGGGWNLIGNPYASYLDFDAFFQLNKAEFDEGGSYQAVYGYDGDASNGWTVWNQATIDEGSITELIAPGQGFFVKSKAGGGLVDFTTSMRVVGDSDDFILGRNANNNASLCKLNISNSSNQAYTQIYFIDGTTQGLDPGYDASTYSGSGSSFSISSQLVQDNTGMDMAIQSLPYNDLNDITIPLGVNASAGSQIHIGMDAISALPENINVYLEDNQTNTFTLLNNADYIFTPNNNLSGSGRFYLHFSNQTLSVRENILDDLVIYTDKNPKTIKINGFLSMETEADVYDVQGRLVKSFGLDISKQHNVLDASDLKIGIYIVKLSNTTNTKTQRIILQ